MSLLGKRTRKTDPKESTNKRNPLISEELQAKLGPILGNLYFLELFQKLYFPEKSIEECAQYIVDSSTHRNTSYIQHIISYIQAEIFPEVKTGIFLLDIFEKVMKTYTLYMFQKNPSNTILCIFYGYQFEVKLISATIENGKTCFLSEIFELVLVNDSKTVQYVAKLRKDIRLNEPELGKVCFELSDDLSNPPIVLGKGSYGFVFKIMGTDGLWYIVKVFYTQNSAEHEWSALKLVMGKHPCLQQVIELQTERKGDIEHIIVSKYQGEIVLSKIKDSIYHITFQQYIWMFMELLDGIDIVHGRGILHCDIKPDNIIIQVNPDGTLRLVLIDFGIAEKEGLEVKEPQSYYTWWYRIPELNCADLLRSKMNKFMEPLTLSRCADWWAFFISFLHVISLRTNNFLGFRSRTEEEVRRDIIEHSPATKLFFKMKPHLGEDDRNIKFVRAIYFVLFKEEGPEKFVETFKEFGIELTGSEMYDEYLKMFKKLRKDNPMIAHVKNVFRSVYCEETSFDISEPMNRLIELFIEILCDGSDLSLLDCLTMDKIQQWVDRLDSSMVELCKLQKRIFFY